jgi:phosphatidylethanolamine-binding protein (PEBP) family uncharacterized protein
MAAGCAYTRKLSRMAAGSACIGALALAGCGNSASSASTNRKATIELTSPALTGNHRIPARYTCDGKDVLLPLKWGAVPSNTAELVVFILALKPVRTETGAVREQASIQWVAAGLNPTLHDILAGELPSGATLGRNRVGQTRYSICPTKGKPTNYLALLYALPQRLSTPRGFQGSALFNEINHLSTTHGLFVFNYTRT